MGTYKEIEGDLIKLAKAGEFDVIAHGCNCFNTMGAGIAPQMAKAFHCDELMLESEEYRGEVNKMGQIDFNLFDARNPIVAVNCYTQYGMGKFAAMGEPDLDYEALTLCLRKIASKFNGDHIGLPQIGCGLAGGDWERVKLIIQHELRFCDVTVVIYNK